jgi:hypothetical protein
MNRHSASLEDQQHSTKTKHSLCTCILMNSSRKDTAYSKRQQGPHHITSQLLKAIIDTAPAGRHTLSQATTQQQQLAGPHGCCRLPCPTVSLALLLGPPLHHCQALHVMHHYIAFSCWEMPPSVNCCGEICCYHCPASAHHYDTISRMLE